MSYRCKVREGKFYHCSLAAANISLIHYQLLSIITGNRKSLIVNVYNYTEEKRKSINMVNKMTPEKVFYGSIKYHKYSLWPE